MSASLAPSREPLGSINGLAASAASSTTSTFKAPRVYPQLAVRELVANALIHQDLFVTGAGPMVEIDFAPLTLLFGANSAGKSTILQALVYLHELTERGAADVDRTELGGHVLELGGFSRLVHRHQSERAMVLRAEFSTPGALERLGRDLGDFPFPDLDDEVESAWVELTIRNSVAPGFRGPLVHRAVIGVNGDTEPLVWLELGPSLRDGEPIHTRVNLGHPVLAEAVGLSQRTLFPQHAYSEVAEAWIP